MHLPQPLSDMQLMGGTTMTTSTGGRGQTPQFQPGKYRGTLPELLALFKHIEEILATPVEGLDIAGHKTEYVSAADNLDSFVVRKGESSAHVLGLESFTDKNMVVSFVGPTGEKEKAELGKELFDLVQKRNRALTQLEVFLQQQLAEGKVSDDRKAKLEEILANVSQYQSSLMHGIDQQLKLSEKVVKSK
jgi:hypothetical protein